MTPPHLHIVRTFSWGLLLVSDRGTSDLPTDVPTAPDFAAATRSAVAINVRHAQDVEGDEESAEVTVNLHPEGSLPGAVNFRAILDVTSGTLEIGDAEASQELEIGAGSWSLTLTATPADHPTNIDLWIERLA